MNKAHIINTDNTNKYIYRETVEEKRTSSTLLLWYIGSWKSINLTEHVR